MAPEILKYLGKEAYNEKVDLFSYAMVIYEMITFRVPFEHLTPNQANQANESGTRPTLKKKVSMSFNNKYYNFHVHLYLKSFHQQFLLNIVE